MILELFFKYKTSNNQADILILDGYYSKKTILNTSRKLIKIVYKTSMHNIVINLK